MVIGRPPFYAEDPAVTQLKIVSWRQHLSIPERPDPALPPLSAEARALLQCLICDPDDRADYERIRQDPFFQLGVPPFQWANRAANIPPHVPAAVDYSVCDGRCALWILCILVRRRGATFQGQSKYNR